MTPIDTSRETVRRWAAKWRAPFAVLALATDGRALTELHFRPLDDEEFAATDAVAEQAVRELERYVGDASHRFAVPIAPRGSAFQRRAWDAMRAIPCGETISYGELARSVGSTPRALGQACGANPIAVIVPCHRVVAAGRRIGGFMNSTGDASLAIKRWLLAHEHASAGLFRHGGVD